MAENRRTTDDNFFGDDFDNEYEDCPNCGGEGFIYDCIDGCCEFPDEGCDLCERRCDWCRGRG